MFESLAAARKLTAAWRDDYNHHRPHSSLGYLTPVRVRGPLRCFRSEVAFGYASSNFSAPAVQRNYPTRTLITPGTRWQADVRDIYGSCALRFGEMLSDPRRWLANDVLRAFVRVFAAGANFTLSSAIPSLFRQAFEH